MSAADGYLLLIEAAAGPPQDFPWRCLHRDCLSENTERNLIRDDLLFCKDCRRATSMHVAYEEREHRWKMQVVENAANRAREKERGR